MTEIGRIGALWRHPVKSMQGESVDSALVGPEGMAGDRAFALLDDESGYVVSGKRPKRWGDVMHCSARSGPEGPEVELPDGRTFAIEDPVLPGALGELFGRAVSVVDRAPESAGFEEVWARDLKAGVDPYVDTPSSEVDGEEMIIGGTTMSSDGNFFNFGSLHLITTGTLHRLAELAPGSDFDARRFRPNVVIDSDDTGFVENDWLGRELRIGELTLRVSILVPRCVMTTLPFGDVPADREVLRTITAHNMVDQPGESAYPCAGVYVDATVEGQISVGDSVELID